MLATGVSLVTRILEHFELLTFYLLIKADVRSMLRMTWQLLMQNLQENLHIHLRMTRRGRGRASPGTPFQTFPFLVPFRLCRMMHALSLPYKISLLFSPRLLTQSTHSECICNAAPDERQPPPVSIANAMPSQHGAGCLYVAPAVKEK